MGSPVLIPPRIREPKLSEIRAAVCEALRIDNISGHGRRLSNARHIAYYFGRKLTKASLKEIAMYLGGCKHHTTVLHGAGKIELQRRYDPELERLLAGITAKLQAPPIPMVVGPAMAVDKSNRLVSANPEFIELLAEAVARKLKEKNAHA